MSMQLAVIHSQMSLSSLFASTDVRSITLLAGACVVGFIFAQPSPMIVRVSFVAIATLGITSLILKQHNTDDDSQRADSATTTSLFGPPGAGASAGAGTSTRNRARGRPRPRPHPHGQSQNAPFATLMHPEATRAIASLAPLSRPGRRATVRSVVLTTEAVMQAYHALLMLPTNLATHTRASACIDDLRDRSITAMDALQGLRMSTGSRGPAASLVASAERDLRALFKRFRQIAANKLRKPELLGGPLALDPLDDVHLVR